MTNQSDSPFLNPNVFAVEFGVTSGDSGSVFDFLNDIPIAEDNNEEWNHKTKDEIKYNKRFIGDIVIPPVDSTGAD